MNEDGKKRYEESMMRYLRGRVSRAQLLKATGAGLALTALPKVAGAQGISFPFYPQVPGTYTPESILSILNIAVTAEHLAVSFLSAAVQNASQLGITGNPLILATVQALLAEETYHVQYLEAAGAKTLTDNFTLPSAAIMNDYVTFFTTAEAAETIFVAAYMTAVREFAEQGQPTLSKVAYQIGAVEAEHRVIARAALALKGDDNVPPPNKAFETDLFVYVKDAATLLQNLGFLGTGPVKLTYPGTGTALALAGAMATAVEQQTPNNATSSATTLDQVLHPGGQYTFTTQLTGSAETPAGAPTGTGIASFTINPATGQLCYTLNVSGITLPAVAAHIHKGAVGVAGAVVIPLTAPDVNGNASACITVDKALLADIAANPQNYYVNVHSKEYPGGAIRGQLG